MKATRPPRLAEKLFDWYCGYAKVDDLKGDLDEWFELNTKTKSLFRARLIYWKQIFSLLFSYSIRKRKRDASHGQFSSHYFSMSMLHNYLKVSARTLYRHKYFSIVNAVGLAIGMSIGLLVITMTMFVKTYDNFHPKGDGIYRIISMRTENVEQRDMATAPAVLALKLKEDYSLPVETVRINKFLQANVLLERQTLPLTGYYTEPSFLSVFNFPLLRGDKITALEKPNSLLLTETAAKKFFGTADALGKTLELEGEGSFEVTGILKDLPINTHFLFEALASYRSLPAEVQGDGSTHAQWTDYPGQYVYLHHKNSQYIDQLNQALLQIAKEQYQPKDEVRVSFALQALNEITPGPDYWHAIGPAWDYQGLIIFGIIAALILLPACFNYTNISIARALKRSKEIGLRKTMGSAKNQIFFQFITETFLITMASLIGAFLIFLVIRSEFQTMLVAASSLDFSITWQIGALFISFALVTGLIAGALPAFFFAGLNPIQALKNQNASRASAGMRVRKGLTIFQFALSFCFILSLVVFSRQYQYSLNYDFGFQKENILDVQLQGVDPQKFKNEFSKLSSVQSMSMSSNVMGLSYSTTYALTPDKADSLEVSQMFIDEHYLANTGLKLLAGKNFPEGLAQHEQFMIVNEEFVKTKQLAQPLDAIGKIYRVEENDLEVIGVVKNFHYASLRQPIKSFCFRTNPAQFHYANLKVAFPEDAYASLSEMEKVWATLVDNRKFQAKFFENEIHEAYDFYQTLLKIVGFLGLMALSISLLGLLGMVVYTSEGKTKEVGIRKVLGATTTGITILLSKDYLKLMLWAAAFAIPITVLIFDKLIPGMQYYSVTLSVWDVLLSLSFLLVMGLTTIASQTYKTASANPAETLKYE